MPDPLKQRIVDVIQTAVRETVGKPDVTITADDSMDTVADWDSISFMSVFLAVNEAFGLNPDFDDAIHYTSVEALYAYLKGQGG